MELIWGIFACYDEYDCGMYLGTLVESYLPTVDSNLQNQEAERWFGIPEKWTPLEKLKNHKCLWRGNIVSLVNRDFHMWPTNLTVDNVINIQDRI